MSDKNDKLMMEAYRRITWKFIQRASKEQLQALVKALQERIRILERMNG